MTITKICSEEIVDGGEYKKDCRTTHIRVEGKNFVQYFCNPTPEFSMKKVQSDVEGFIAHAKEVNGHIFSYVLETIGGEVQTTFHYQS